MQSSKGEAVKWVICKFGHSHEAKLSKIKQMWHLQMVCSKFAIGVNPVFRPVLQAFARTSD